MYKYADESWTLFTPGSGLTMNPSCMTPLGAKLYFGHYGGIDIYENENWSYINFASVGVSINYVFDIEFDWEYNMWLGTSEGLWKYDGTDWTNWNTSNSNIAADPVWAVEIDRTRNIIYAGAHNTQIWPYYGGISYFNGTGNEFTTYLEGSSPIAHKQVEDLALDTLGNIWILTQSEGITVHNPNGLIGFECIDRRLQTQVTEVTSNKEIVNDFILSQNYPNPFNPSTTIQFSIPQSSFTTLKVYNLLGEEVAVLLQKEINAGVYEISLDASHFPSGVYVYVLKAGKLTQSRKMMLIK